MASTSKRNQSESDMDCDEIICDLSDTSDTEIYSYHDTDSEQNSEADEELPNDDSEFYFGKDGVTKWKKTMWQKTQIRTRSTNIISQLPGPKSEAKSIESESDAFTKIIDNDMVQKIVDCTNAYISNIKEHFSRERDAKLTTVTEILALFGLLIMSGVKRAAHLTYKELWAVDGSGVEINTTLVSYVPIKSKAVLLLSTMHSTPTIDEESGFKLKPEIVTFYNLTKGGVDMVNQMCGTYSVGRRTNRWPLSLFFDVLNVAGINSEIIFKSLNINSPRVPRRIFLKNISLQLFQDHLKIRSQLKNLPRSLHDLIILHCKKAESPEIEMSVESEPKKRKRCYVCPSTKGHRKRRQFKQTDAFTRGMVIGLKRAGWSIRQIAADTHLGASTVHRLWRRWLEQGNVAINRNVGATRVTSARVDRRILRQAVAAPQVTCTAILQHVQDTLDHSISTRTISRRLVANGLHSCRPLRRLPLTPPNRRQRLEWCRARSTWMTEWHRVVFSDESRFCLSSDSRRVRVWRRRGERSNPAAIAERPTVRQRGIMVWGAIAYDSRSPLLRIQGTMTAQRYVDDVLRPVTLPYLQGVPNALYQQDNARPHTARISQQALQDVQMLPWPPYSPDLSPIEHVWDIIIRRLHALPQPRSEDELWQMVEREWRAIPQDAIRTLIDSLPRRVAACIAVRGGPTCY
ncbi:hypothetical protein LAZ67_15001152 [Cordylochernes scorpioides]|uniref:Transposase n=1 Tax=Cordylochernes scorpioides TaxID=51811 RepID=A0ABY6LDC4_9ARAC|nr:hypothetical protein LAZ67_15001152 [Cordylochernes scorpioides]